MLESHRSAPLSVPDQLGKLQRARSLTYDNLRERKSLEFARAPSVRASPGVFITGLVLIHIEDVSPAHFRLPVPGKRVGRPDSAVAAESPKRPRSQLEPTDGRLPDTTYLQHCSTVLRDLKP